MTSWIRDQFLWRDRNRRPFVMPIGRNPTVDSTERQFFFINLFFIFLSWILSFFISQTLNVSTGRGSGVPSKGLRFGYANGGVFNKNGNVFDFKAGTWFCEIAFRSDYSGGGNLDRVRVSRVVLFRTLSPTIHTVNNTKILSLPTLLSSDDSKGNPIKKIKKFSFFFLPKRIVPRKLDLCCSRRTFVRISFFFYECLSA